MILTTKTANLKTLKNVSFCTIGSDHLIDENAKLMEAFQRMRSESANDLATLKRKQTIYKSQNNTGLSLNFCKLKKFIFSYYGKMINILVYPRLQHSSSRYHHWPVMRR